MRKKDGLLNLFVNANGLTSSGAISLGARGDSYYEYLLKEWLLSGKTRMNSLGDYKEAVHGIQRHLIQRTSGPLNLTFVAELQGGSRPTPKMDHVVCFLPGLLALGAQNGLLPSWIIGAR